MHNHLNYSADIIELLFNSLPFSYVFWKNTEGVYMGASSNQLKMFDIKGRGFIGKTIFEILNDYPSAKAIHDIDTKIMQEGIPQIIEEVVVTQTGEKKVFLSQKQPIRDNQNNIIGLIGFSIDITERKKIEDELLRAKDAAEAASRAKTEFLENMRHDIRTPLTGIIGFADILKMEAGANPHIRDYAENLVASSYALLDLMDEVLEAIRVGSGEIPKLKKKFNLKKALQHIIDLNRAKAAEKKLAFTLELDEALPTRVIGDKVRLHRIVLELIANALNFTDSGFVRLKVTLAKRERRELIIKLVVEDSGMGIAPDKQQEIYVQFKRLTPSYQGIYKGAGLGLAVVKQFIDDLDGEIYVKSELRKGSQFICIIPLQEPLLDDDLDLDEESDSLYEKTYANEIKPIQSKAHSHQYHVLLVEDNQIAQAIAKSMLVPLHCKVDVAENGQQALALWKANPYDLIFMDIGLPDIDGYEVTHRIRVQELAQHNHTPIIALTAHASDENKKRCIEAGMNAVLTKPLTAKSCHDIVDAFIPGHRLESVPGFTGRSADVSNVEDELFNLSSFPLLDTVEAIKTLGNTSTLAEMLRFMVDESLPHDTAELTQAYDTQNWSKVQHSAHKIKGGAVYVGTLRLNKACQNLERFQNSDQPALLERLYQQVSNVIGDTTQEIRKWLAKYEE